MSEQMDDLVREINNLCPICNGPIPQGVRPAGTALHCKCDLEVHADCARKMTQCPQCKRRWWTYKEWWARFPDLGICFRPGTCGSLCPPIPNWIDCKNCAVHARGLGLLSHHKADPRHTMDTCTICKQAVIELEFEELLMQKSDEMHRTREGRT